jgi:hypothetical protein
LWNCGKEGEGKGSNKAEAMTDGKRPRLGQNKPLDRNRNYRIRHNRKEIGSERKKKKKKKPKLKERKKKTRKVYYLFGFLSLSICPSLLFSLAFLSTARD